MENFHSYTLTPSFSHLLSRKSLYALFSLFLLLLLAYNTATLFCIRLPFPGNIPSEPNTFSPENVAGKLVSLSSSAKISSSVMYAVKEENSDAKPHTHLAISRKNRNFLVFTNNSLMYNTKRRKHKGKVKVHEANTENMKFSARIKEFLHRNSSFTCKQKFFMTWISPLETFGDREILAIESLFKSHPSGCLIIVSNAMDSTGGLLILKPFLEKGFKVMPISPDYNYLFQNTPAQAWINQLMTGKINPGEVSLGQNLSNLLRLGLLFKFGGIYLDTDVIILKSFRKLRNVIGAQTIDRETKNWSRLNNAVMIFDKGHPLLYKFIEEFALTFDGNKWGHNGPYLVSRVVSRVISRPGYNFTISPPLAFYPVDWSRIGSLFEGAKNETQQKWLVAKLDQIRNRSFAVHLWNKQSRKLEVEDGSIIQHILSDCCLFCKSIA